MKINESDSDSTGKILIIIYEVKQIDQILEYLNNEKISINTCHIVAIEYGVERELLKRSIAYTSLTDYISLDADLERQLHLTELTAKSFHEHRAMDFFVNKNIRLGEIIEILFQFYLDQLIYGFYICDKIIKSSPRISSMLVPYSTVAIWSTSSPLVPSDLNVMPTAFKYYAEVKGIAFVNLGNKEVLRLKISLFKQLKDKILKAMLYAHNIVVEFLVSPKPIKIFVSDYWRHIQPFITKMDDVELIVMDKSEAPKIGLRQIWKHRMRFYHPDDFKTKEDAIKAESVMRTFSVEWDKARTNTDFHKLFIYDDIPYWSVVEPILRLLITGNYARSMVSDSIYLEKLLIKNKINRALLRATSSRQYHFLITARMAEGLDIPSIELQHAVAITEPTSAYSLLGSRYLAAYGKRTRDARVQNHGYDPNRIVPVGSPRFDRYIRDMSKGFDREETLKKLSLDPSRPVLMVNVPHISELGRSYYGGSSRLYDVIKLLKEVALLQKDVEGLQIILKFRPKWFGPQYKMYLEEIFAGNMKDVAVAEFEDVSKLMRSSDIITSGYSTMVIEALINKTPVILYPLRKWARAFRELFKGTVLDAHSQSELTVLIKKLLNDADYRKNVVKDMELFLKEEYSFDGKASERIMSLLRNPPALEQLQTNVRSEEI